MPALSLSQLCSEAADHVARARLSLFDEGADADRALLHLDEAIFCLKRLLAEGRAGMRESRKPAAPPSSAPPRNSARSAIACRPA